MTLNPGCEEEYRKRHNPIWPKLEKVLKDHGVHNYSIFLDSGSNSLFGYAEIESEDLWQKIAETDMCRRWWAHMAELMLTNEDNSPVVSELTEVFHLD